MVTHHQKCDEEGQIEKGRHHHLALLFFFIFFLVFFSFFLGSLLFIPASSKPVICKFFSLNPSFSPSLNPSFPGSFDSKEERLLEKPAKAAPLGCSHVPDNSICCDRTHNRSDICVLRGNVRVVPSLSSVFLHGASSLSPPEKIRPYTRKWESNVMNTIDELNLVTLNASSDSTACDVIHDVPAVIFSTGGYTGNVYHEFNDGLIPLYITSRGYNRRVVFVILEYHNWWITKYKDILPLLSDYPPIDFSSDNRTHCFPEVTVGLRIHGELSVDPSPNITIFDFRNLLEVAYRPRVLELENKEAKVPVKRDDAALMMPTSSPKLVIISRNGSRGMDNEEALVGLCEEIGFRVKIVRPDRTTEMAKMYRDLNSSDAMIGVHGAAMTHLLFMRPGSVFIQIIPLGTDWAAESYYGSPAKKLGLKYIPYKIKPSESSLSKLYKSDDPVLRNPDEVNKRGWEVTKNVYLGGQTVEVDLNRFLKRLTRAYQHIVKKKMEEDNSNLRWKENWLPR